ncbi:hypothetical protein [Moraxella catarrhalis]|nr:hypothetical protein [Moraxella catarrhalis]
MAKTVQKDAGQLYAKIIALERLLDSPKPSHIQRGEWVLMKDQLY